VKKSIAAVPLMLAAASAVSGCDLIAGIFKAGFFFGLIVVVAVIAAIIWLISRAVS
jgi:hypothetical protein